MEQILVPVSPGELLDKITILEIKAERIDDEEKVRNVELELSLLNDTWDKAGLTDETTLALKSELKTINEALWEIEDDIRDCERDKSFAETFIKLARDVYFTNDRRSDVKKKLNLYLGSDIVEEKSYQDYT